ncbi:MAG: nucleotidyl transferase AbiEii/AbiGii toxin family protein [Candidatus Omnitrophica bacterium]|nr:nucleotidyl transferase AbiEii/AbiGii toxin family protein [Candidatus Omnitrophota bacterium]
MIELKALESFFPPQMRQFKRNILREYLQYKILAVIFGAQFSHTLAFMGGTAIHIVHGSSRFSEDLDFDNRGLGKSDFKALVNSILRTLSLEGFRLESSVSFRGAFSADIKITGLLYELGLSGHTQEKIVVKLDAEPQDFRYQPRRVIINKFDVVAGIAVVPEDILLAQKLYAIIKRKRPMGRDFYDAMFLAGKTKPNYGYLKKKVNIADVGALKEALRKRCVHLDFKQLSRDVAPFVFVPGDAKKIELFTEFIEGL